MKGRRASPLRPLLCVVIAPGRLQTCSQSVEAMRRATSQVGESVGRARFAGQALQQIQATVDATTARAEEISQRAQLLAVSSKQLVDAMTRLAAITEENTTSSEEIAATSEQVLSSATRSGR